MSSAEGLSPRARRATATLREMDSGARPKKSFLHERCLGVARFRKLGPSPHGNSNESGPRVRSRGPAEE
eukprot:8015498-Lingulodinium_polyedra.AAC.1